MQTETKSRIHPLLATAAIAVIVLCVVGVAAITGYLPGSSAQKTPPEPAAALTQPAAPAAAPVAPAPVAAASAPAETATAPKPKPAQAAAKPSAPKSPAQPVAAPAPAPVVAAAPIAPPKPVCVDCGVVTGVSEVEVKGQASGLGAVAGGVAGAVIGNQVGSGSTRTIARIAGAAGGAYAGHQIEKNARTAKKYDVGVKLDDGTVRTISYDAPPTWRAGDRVRIVGGKLELAN